MVVEEMADHPVSFGDVTRQLEEASFPCTTRQAIPALPLESEFIARQPLSSY
jgi:hypothetical protein